MNWIDSLIHRSYKATAISQSEQKLIDKLIDVAYIKSESEGKNLGLILAAFYDLAISAVYYSHITNSGWMYCKNQGSPKLILPFVNCCPIHTLNNEFIFHKSSKPTSAKIGEATSRILLLFLKALFAKSGKRIEIYDACEPADAIILERELRQVFFAEIKASPLLTMSLATDCDLLTEVDDDGNEVQVSHKTTANPILIGSVLYIMLPIRGYDGTWKMRYYPIGCKSNINDGDFAYNGINILMNDEAFLNDYLDYWIKSFELYCNKDDSETIFWFTNACGKPSGLKEWAGGTTCISDAKTSVGMDRTDDIKKGIYQVLKLGSEGKQSASQWNYKVGILSNIHPARHFGSYIKPIKDMVWTTTSEKNVNFAKDLPADTPMYNLFDGIITFTDSYIRDRWLLEGLFDFIE